MPSLPKGPTDIIPMLIFFFFKQKTACTGLVSERGEGRSQENFTWLPQQRSSLPVFPHHPAREPAKSLPGSKLQGAGARVLHLRHIGQPLQDGINALEVVRHDDVGDAIVIHDLHATQLVVGCVNLSA